MYSIGYVYTCFGMHRVVCCECLRGPGLPFFLYFVSLRLILEFVFAAICLTQLDRPFTALVFDLMPVCCWWLRVMSSMVVSMFRFLGRVAFELGHVCTFPILLGFCACLDWFCRLYD